MHIYLKFKSVPLRLKKLYTEIFGGRRAVEVPTGIKGQIMRFGSIHTEFCVPVD